MKITSAIVGILIFSISMVMIGRYYGNVQSVYAPANSTYIENFTYFNQSLSKMETNANATRDAITSMVQKAWWDPTKIADFTIVIINAGGILMESANTFLQFTTPLLGFFKIIPAEITYFVLVVIIVLFVLRIASIVMKTEEI